MCRLGVSFILLPILGVKSSSDWLTFGAVCNKVLSTLLLVSGESVCRREFARRELREDTLNIGCFDNGMKLSIDSVFLKFFYYNQ